MTNGDDTPTPIEDFGVEDFGMTKISQISTQKMDDAIARMGQVPESEVQAYQQEMLAIAQENDATKARVQMAAFLLRLGARVAGIPLPPSTET